MLRVQRSDLWFAKLLCFVAIHDVCLLLQAKNKVGQAKSSVANATNKVEAALRDVQDIMKELGDLTALGK